MPEAEEYTRDELVRVLQAHGPRLMRGYFRPEADLDELIRCSVGGNTFRSFQKLAQPPSQIFRSWARSQLTFGMMQELGRIEDQVGYDSFVNFHSEHLTRHWLVEGRKPLRFGSGRKLIDLLFKRVVRCTEVSEESRQRLIRFLHVPLDEYSLTAVRQCAASNEFGLSFAIPRTVSMGWVDSVERYSRVQQLMRQVATVAGVAPICLDLLAWDHAHSI